MSAYKEVIDILMSPGEFDYKRIAINLAKEHPEIFLQMVQRSAPPVPGWHQEIISLLKTERKVDAIKLLRVETGFGLKEAKDVCDNLGWDLYRKGMMQYHPSSMPCELDDRLEDMRQELYRSACR
jgi:hypothetical protein